MIALTDITLYRGPKCLLNDTRFTAHAGWHIGLTGRNGTGKSTLFALLQGQIHLDGGHCSIPANWQIAHMAQEVPGIDQSALDYVIDGDKELRQLQRTLATAEAADDHQKIAEAHQHMDSIDAYTAESRAAKLLTGLGFTTAQFGAAVKSFSGGWRMRLNLAQTLMCRSDLLLLDEPTNHLDLDTILWLEGWLKQYPGTLILISHDRDFLDSTVQHILHLEHQQLNHYKGNYSQFEIMRAQKLTLQQAAYDKQQKEIAHMQSFINRFKAKASKAKQAQSRVKALDRLEEIAPAHVDSPFHFHFYPPAKLADQLIRVDHGTLGYRNAETATTILSKVNLQLSPDSRIGLLGPNGAGKSTLIKTLVGDNPLLEGELLRSEHCAIGYFAQHQLDHLDLEATPLLLLQRKSPKVEESRLRSYLGSFAFNGDNVNEKIGTFSGGEKARLALALIIWDKPNVLLLDEPTNHLDLEMRHALTMALQSYEGALVVVSHDRHLIRNTTDDLLLVANGQVTDFSGDLEDYARWLSEHQAQQQNTSSSSNSNEKTERVDRKAERQKAAELRNQLRPLKKQIDKLEKQIDKYQKERLQIESELSDTALYEAQQKDKLTDLLKQQGIVTQALEDAELEWMDIQDQYEQLEAQLSAEY